MLPALPAPVSFERDGAVVKADFLDKVAVERAGGMPVTIEPYPDNGGILKLLKEKHPFVDFVTKSKFDTKKVHYAMMCCLKALEPLKRNGEDVYKTPANTTDFGMVVSAALEPYVSIAEGKSMEYWEVEGGIGRWRVMADGNVLLVRAVRNTLLSMFRKQRLSYEDGKSIPHHSGAEPAACMRRNFYFTVAQDVSVLLYAP